MAVGAEGDEHVVALAAVRALLRAETRAAAADVLHRAVEQLGGRVGLRSDRRPDETALDLDVSLGLARADGQSLVVLAGAEGVVRLQEHLPALLDDFEAAVARADGYEHRVSRARLDALTGLAGRGETDARLAACSPGDVVCLLDLDGFKRVNDTHGHQAGDQELRRFADLLRSWVRGEDFVGRYGGDEFLVVLDQAPMPVAVRRMRDLVDDWAARGSEVGVSVGVARVGDRVGDPVGGADHPAGGSAALAHADRALYAAKRAGGARVELG